jgi:hypothetical protein
MADKMTSKGPRQMPQPLGLYASDLFRRSDDYLAASERLLHSSGRELLFPVFFLLVHGYELLFKSYLATRNTPKKRLKELGHRLSALREQCEIEKMPTVPELEIYIAALNEMNGDDDFRYPIGYVLKLPPPNECLRIARELQALVAPIVSSSHVDATLDLASNTRRIRGRKIQWSD